MRHGQQQQEHQNKQRQQKIDCLFNMESLVGAADVGVEHGSERELSRPSEYEIRRHRPRYQARRKQERNRKQQVMSRWKSCCCRQSNGDGCSQIDSALVLPFRLTLDLLFSGTTAKKSKSFGLLFVQLLVMLLLLLVLLFWLTLDLLVFVALLVYYQVCFAPCCSPRRFQS